MVTSKYIWNCSINIGDQERYLENLNSFRDKERYLNFSINLITREYIGIFILISWWHAFRYLKFYINFWFNISDHGLGVSHWATESLGKALDYRSLGHGLGVRHWTTDHWVRHWTTDHWSWSRGKALDYRSLGHGLGVRHWTTDHWVRHWTTDHWVMV